MNYSTFQNEIFNFVKNNNNNLVVDAVAGSGKTTTIVKVGQLLKGNNIFLAFNKSIANVLAMKMPNTKCTTIHSLGFSYLKNKKVDDKKYIKLCNIAQQKEDYGLLHTMLGDVKYTLFPIIKKMIDLIRVNLIEEGSAEINALLEKHDLLEHTGLIPLCYRLLEYGCKSSYIDFVDMVYLPVAKGLVNKVYDNIIVDECQDLSSVSRKFILSLGKRFIAVGDPKQAIYGFAGADAGSFQDLCNVPNTMLLPLSVTYRCAKSIVDYVKHIVPQIEASPNAEMGVVNEESSVENIGESDMVLCRTTKPIIILGMRLRSNGLRVHIKSDDVTNKLEQMIKNAYQVGEKYSNEKVISYAIGLLNSKIQGKVLAGLSRDEAMQKEDVIVLSEQVEILVYLGNVTETPQEMLDLLGDMFSEKDSCVTLSTIHKAKGLEGNRAFIICPELLPHPRAKKDWELAQEQNLRYVAYTRAKKQLHIVKDFETATKISQRISEKLDLDGSGEIKGKKESSFVSEYAGKVGDVFSDKLTVFNINTFKGKYGLQTVINLVDEKGRCFVRFGTTKKFNPSIGDVIVGLGFEIKKHSFNSFSQRKETTLGKIV